MLNVAVLCSKRAPGLEELRERVNVVCVLERNAPRGSDRRAFDAETAALLLENRDPKVGRALRARRVLASTRDGALGERALPCSDALPQIDAVVCLGYLYIITEPLLAAFPNRILSVHDADLTLRDASGGPRYPGLHATRDAIYAGERETRSCAHIVTPELDGGPIVARSAAFPVASFVHDAVKAKQHDIVRAYAYAQREWMMRSTWGALAAEAVQRLVMEAVA
jgi:folate-dependent phosphoribosylglycinamide formyltransferase PurN